MLTAILLLLLDAPCPVPSATVRTYDLTTLTPTQAYQLVGKRARYHVQLDTPVEPFLQYLIAGCRTNSDVERSVYFLSNQVVGDDEVDVEIEGRLHVIHHNAWQQVPAWTEYRILDAVRVEPR